MSEFDDDFSEDFAEGSEVIMLITLSLVSTVNLAFNYLLFDPFDNLKDVLSCLEEGLPETSTNVQLTMDMFWLQFHADMYHMALQIAPEDGQNRIKQSSIGFTHTVTELLRSTRFLIYS